MQNRLYRRRRVVNEILPCHQTRRRWNNPHNSIHIKSSDRPSLLRGNRTQFSAYTHKNTYIYHHSTSRWIQWKFSLLILKVMRYRLLRDRQKAYYLIIRMYKQQLGFKTSIRACIGNIWFVTSTRTRRW